MIMVRPLVKHVREFDVEARIIKSWISDLTQRSEQPLRLLEIGCGFGRNLKNLKDLPIDLTGVDINESAVAECKRLGFKAYSSKQLKEKAERFNILLLSHIIEHFSPDNLITFLNDSLNYLDKEGVLIIATPLYSPYFYDDFDHVKPYNPLALKILFEEESPQLRFNFQHRLTLLKLKYRRNYFRFTHVPEKYVYKRTSFMVSLLEFFSATIFYCSKGVLGKKDGWIGLFRLKTSQPHSKPH